MSIHLRIKKANKLDPCLSLQKHRMANNECLGSRWLEHQMGGVFIYLPGKMNVASELKKKKFIYKILTSLTGHGTSHGIYFKSVSSLPFI